VLFVVLLQLFFYNPSGRSTFEVRQLCRTLGGNGLHKMDPVHERSIFGFEYPQGSPACSVWASKSAAKLHEVIKFTAG